jgi:GT2 family glycosyltransferase
MEHAMSESPIEPLHDKLGIVVIGRNEGARLRTCLQSVMGSSTSLVYVDSASSDGSVELAHSLGVNAVALDPALGLSAARARNLGLKHLIARDPELEFVQFVDGDCELLPTWLTHAREQMAADPRRVIVAGRLLERNVAGSLYNRLCSLEWQREAGEVTDCGGLFLGRVAALQAAGGFRGDVIAGEENELCLRLRRDGGVIIESPHEMAWHDSAMLRFGQWWQRAKRGGFAYAQVAQLHGKGPERHGARECRRILLWGGLLPTVSLALAWPTAGWSLLLLLAYPLQFLRVAAYGKSRGWSSADARLYAFFTLLDKLPSLQGLLLFHWRRLRGRAMSIIEHKDP